MSKRVSTIISALRLRPEYFGGFVFNSRMHTIAEVDHIQYDYLVLLQGKVKLTEITKQLQNKYPHVTRGYLDKILIETNELVRNMDSYWDGLQ